ncbi:DUF3054 domain-containing protein [Nocardioides sp. JQ2195]|uniref:DUF3054 domain-containing protein n=1 Tax=Nocardioides sp. JQ2195 TaxID=2592334 RepID=UPI00143ECDF9|nr:DUF3054 domain-containing protein [Nocardioides sp. JQ2195]QIX26692.1 DUF3054 domain-containing protein [Nocardioides sp. JQ2195]
MSPRALKALVADLVLILLFAALGRAEHDRGNVVLGVLGTAWPFLVGALLGWILVRQLGRREAVAIGPGITVWISTVLLGMVLRQLSGAGTAFSFIVVATVVLGVFLVGSRAVVALIANRKVARASATRGGAGQSVPATDE